MLCQQFLNLYIVQKLALSQAKDLKSLLLRHEPALDPQALFGYLLAAHVCVLLAEGFVVLFIKISFDLQVSLFGGQRANILDLVRVVVVLVTLFIISDNSQILSGTSLDILIPLIIIFLIILHFLLLEALKLGLLSVGK